MPTIPTTFDPSPEDVEIHLTMEPVGELLKVTWPLLGIAIFHKNETYPTLLDCEKNTPTLKIHGNSGYSIGQFSEFFIENIHEHWETAFPNIEVTFGEPTPLAVQLFNAQQDEHVHGEWVFIRTVRLLGADAANAEIVLLHAIQRYAEKFEVQPHVGDLAPVNWMTEEEYEKIPQKLQNNLGQVASDIEPLRCFYYASINREPAASCIQYYRVLEYYAFFTLQAAISTHRNNSALSDRDFLVTISQLLSKDEKGTLVRLVASLADPTVLSDAVKLKLIQNPDPSVFGATLYDFRNSIVHAKYDQRSTLVVDSVTSPGETTRAWRGILERMARLAIDTFSKKLSL